MDNTHSCSCGHCESTIELVSKSDEAHEHLEGNTLEGGKGSSKDISRGISKDTIIQGTKLMIALSLLLVASFAPVNDLISTVLYVTAYILAGYMLFFNAIRGLWKREWLDENFLMLIASVAAFVIGEYAEGVAVIIFYGVGSLFEEMAINRSRRSIQSLMEIKPESARKWSDNLWITCSPYDVAVDDLILVKAGERLPLDGVIIEGNSSLDTSAITGESQYKEVTIGDKVYAGTIAIDGVLTLRVTKLFKESTVNRILELVEQASEKKAHTEKFITQFARYYTPIVVGLAAILAIVPPLLGFGEWMTWFYRAAIFLVVSCPCGLVISVPLGYFGGIGGASRHGILIKGGNFLEVLRKIDTLALDKTGTLTHGVFEVTQIECLSDEVTEASLLQLASKLEQFSEHPIAKSIVEAARKAQDNSQSAIKHMIQIESQNESKIESQNESKNEPQSASYTETYGKSPELSDILEHKGKGMTATYLGKSLMVGNDSFIQHAGFDIPKKQFTGSCVTIVYDNQVLGRIYLGDRIKVEAKKSIEALFRLGVKQVVMLTGDDRSVAENVAKHVGIRDFFAQLLPEDKVTQFEQLTGTVGFVGDGINDAPVLARADVGIAMGGIGSDAAIEAADVVILSDDLNALPKAIKIARYTHKIIWQNILFSFGTKGIILVLAVFGLANMWLAVFADVGVAIIAILNAIRVLRYNPIE